MAGPTSPHRQAKNLAAWLKGHGFTENPFALREAGREERLSEYFVEGPYYNEIRGSAENPRTVFVFAARGCGKSAYRVMIQRSCRPDDRDSPVLAIPYIDFSRVLVETDGVLSQVAVNHHLRAILAVGLTTLLREFVEFPEGFLKLPESRQRIFRALIGSHIPSLLVSVQTLSYSPAETQKRIHGDIRTEGSQVKTTAQIFLSYAREDEEKVEKLYQKLRDAGFKPWMDMKDILPGERWKSSIRKAIRRSDFFLACLSANSVNKRGFLQWEINDALDIWQEKLEDDIYLIPVRLEDCEVPERLRDFQWVNLFEEDVWTRLVKAIQVGMERRAEASADGEPSAGTEMTASEEGPKQVPLLHPTFLFDCLRKWGKEEAADLLEDAAEHGLPEILLGSTSEPLSRFLHTFLTEPLEPLPTGLPLIEHWRALVSLIQRTGLKAVYVLVDGLDEFFETAIDPQTAVTTFLLPLITNLSLMETPPVAFKFFLPLEVSDTLAARFDRLKRRHLEWRDYHLMRMLRSRLQAFSGGRIASLDAIADVDLAGRIDGQLVKWAYGSPRNLLLLGDTLLAVHCGREGDLRPLLTGEDLYEVPYRFEREYEPLVPLLSIDERHQKVLIGGRPIREKLSPLEYELLWFLYQNAGEVKSKDDVYLAVYQTTKGVSDEAIDSLVFRLRQKIEPDPKKPVYLVTQRGRGYRLINVEQV